MNATTVSDPDLLNCDREPIHIPGSIQPHGVLLVLDESQRVVQASANFPSIFGKELSDVLGQPISPLLGWEATEQLIRRQADIPQRASPIYLSTIVCGTESTEKSFDVLAHRLDGITLIDLESNTTTFNSTAHALGFYNALDDFSLRAERVSDIAELSQLTANAVRQLTGFDRVLVYQFDSEWNGIVVGEDGSGRLPVYLHHRFPANDIPAQARELYRLNRVRIIPDNSYQAVPILSSVPSARTPLDMTFSTLRSVSPVHVEYMRNMKTASSMSISIVRNGQLWGLISCHHREPKFAPFALRALCDLIARAFVLRLSALEHATVYERRVDVRKAFASLLAKMTDRGDFAAGLHDHPEELLSFTAASGAAILHEGNCQLVGQTPTAEQIVELAGWLFENNQNEVFSTDSLGQIYPAALAFADKASGLLSIAISQLYPSYVMWFRPEVVQTIEWGGNPKKAMEADGSGLRLHPRKSFETWQETVRNKSLAWDAGEIEGATELRNTIVGIVLRKAEELVELNAELTRSNKELEAFSYSVSHDLRAPLRHIVGYAEMLKESDGDKLGPRSKRCVDVIIESSEYAGVLVDKLLGYSRLGRAELQCISIDMNLLIKDVQRVAMRDADHRKIEWRISALPEVYGDLMMIRMAFGDLVANAVKYTRQQPSALIEIDCREENGQAIFRVSDNGVGFDMQYVDKLFGVFQRLHRWEDYEGTGIGLANVRRVIERHGGRTWAEGAEGKGATFYVMLPRHSSSQGTSNVETNSTR